MKKNIIPFSWWPAFWGMKGKTREIAKAEYELEGFDLERRLLEINRNEYTDEEFKKKIWELEFKYKKIDERTYHGNLVTLIKDETRRLLAELELENRDGKLTEIEYQKKQATIKKEPWVTVLNMNFVSGSSLEGSFELDWNEFFVEKLKAEGYTGNTPDAIVNGWFMELCRNIAMEEFDGTGDFSADSEANLETWKRWNGEVYPGNRKGYR
jgi:hypothetical protein